MLENVAGRALVFNCIAELVKALWSFRRNYVEEFLVLFQRSFLGLDIVVVLFREDRPAA